MTLKIGPGFFIPCPTLPKKVIFLLYTRYLFIVEEFVSCLCLLISYVKLALVQFTQPTNFLPNLISRFRKSVNRYPYMLIPKFAPYFDLTHI